MKDLAVSAECRVVGKVVNDNHTAEEFLMFLLLLVFYHLVLRVDDSLQAFWIVVVEVDGLLFRVLHLHLILNVGASQAPRSYPR